MQHVCSNCHAALAGRYCSACGQKALEDADRRLGHLLAQFSQELLSYDGKLWRSLGYLIGYPGRLTREYFDGRRVRYMSPVSLFLLVNVLYFLAPSISDFNLPFVSHIPGRLVQQLPPAVDPDEAAERQRASSQQGQFHSKWTAALVDEKLAAIRKDKPAYTLGALQLAYDAESSNVSKLLVILHIPFLAAILGLLLFDQRRYYAEHLVAALHQFTVLLLAMVLAGAILPRLLAALATTVSPSVSQWLARGVVIAVMVHCSFGIRRAYAIGRLRSIATMFGFWVGLFMVHIYVYRPTQFLLVLALL